MSKEQTPITAEEFFSGQKVRLDKGFTNSSIVEVVRQTTKRMYTTVTSGKDEWDVMTYRLTPCN